jgi:hypothetical protein
MKKTARHKNHIISHLHYGAIHAILHGKEAVNALAKVRAQALHERWHRRRVGRRRAQHRTELAVVAGEDRAARQKQRYPASAAAHSARSVNSKNGKS